ARGLKRLGQAQRDAPRQLLAAAELAGIGRLVVDDDELRVTPGEPNLDPRGLELAPDLEGDLAEKVEKVQMERRSDGIAHPACRIRGRLVTESRRSGELLPDRLDVILDLLTPIIMPS